jgi:hypothetical protein
VYERNKNGSGAWSGWVLINAPTSTTPIQLTITKSDAVYEPNYKGAYFLNGFLTVYVEHCKAVSDISGDTVIFTVSGVNNTATSSLFLYSCSFSE